MTSAVVTVADLPAGSLGSEPEGSLSDGSAAATESRAAGLPTPPAPPKSHRIRELMAGLAWAAAGFAVLGLAWQFAHWRAPTLPGPTTTFSTLRSLLAHAFVADGPAGKGIGLQLADSLVRVFKGFTLAMVVGIPLGFLIGTSRSASRMFNPVIQLLRPVSPLAWFPIWLTILVKADLAAVG
jgi:nitrate/nitrite transport system permease protein